MTTQYRRFVFTSTPTRIHLWAWNDATRRWVVPCGLNAPGPPTISLDKPLCKMCAKLTNQITPAEDMEYRLA